MKVHRAVAEPDQAPDAVKTDPKAIKVIMHPVLRYYKVPDVFFKAVVQNAHPLGLQLFLKNFRIIHNSEFIILNFSFIPV